MKHGFELQTYDRAFIEKWFHKGHNTCPQTKEVLSDMTLTPNRLLREIISQWCAENGLELPKLVFEEVVTSESECDFDELLNKLSLSLSPSSSLSDQKAAAKELRGLAKGNHEFRALFAKRPESIDRLLSCLLLDNISLHPDLQEDLVTSVLNISIHEDNKKHVAENWLALPVLIESLQYGNTNTKANAAAAISSLACLESNKIIIGNAGALKPLIALLDDDAHPVVIKDAASAIFRLCTIHQNKEQAVYNGAVGSVLRNIIGGIMVDELVSVLALLSSNRKAVEEMCKLDTVPCMLEIMREASAECVKENCVSILFAICTSNRRKMWEIQEDENWNGTILELSTSGNSRARRKAIGILERLHRAASRTHTA